MKLNTFSNIGFDRGASRIKEGLWIAVSGVLFATWLPGTKWRAALLRIFGARIGQGVVIKPGVQVKFPWKLVVGDHCWIGEGVWIDNLGDVTLGDHVCISQGAYLCTGSHDWAKQEFDLIVKQIVIRDHAWVGACSRVGPGVVIEEGAVLGLGSTATHTLNPWSIYLGVPAKLVKKRVMEF